MQTYCDYKKIEKNKIFNIENSISYILPGFRIVSLSINDYKQVEHIGSLSIPLFILLFELNNGCPRNNEPLNILLTSLSKLIRSRLTFFSKR